MPTIVTLEMGGTGAITAADARNTLGVMANTGGTFSGAINAATANITTIVTGNALTLSTGTASNGNIIFSSNGTEDMRITNTGMIGIFTTTPNSNLTVVGNVWATTGINAATINATTSNAATFISSAGINVGAQAINAYGQANSARDQANTGYGQANAARDQANTGYGQANAAYTQANNARADANTTFATINTTFGTVNTSLGTINTNYQAAYAQANAGYGQANAAYAQANSAYGAANTRLSASGGTLSGDLIITGNLTVSGNQTILNTEILSTEDAEIVLLSNVAGTPALNAGLIVNRGTSTNTFVRWNEVTDKWGYSDDGSTFYSYDDIRSGLVTHNTTFGTTNTTFGTTNTTFGTVNTTFGTINTNYQAAYSQANAGANLVAVYANGTVGMANANINFNNTATINVAITANATNKFANVDLTANSTALGIPTINTSLGTLNTTFGTVNTTFGTLNTTFGTINTNATNINSNAINAYAQANTATTNAGNAYGQANTARSDANTTFATINTTFATLNTSAGTQNTTFGTINTTFATSNTNFALKSYWPDATTQLGATTHGLTVFNTTALWSQPAGYETMVNATGSSGLPASHGQSYFGYLITSRRDTGGGYSALLTAYDNSQLWFTYNGTNTSYPTWNKIWHENNDGSGSALDADLWDGYQFADYLNQAVKTTSSPTFSNMTVTGYFTNIRNNASVSAPSTSDHSLGTRLTLYDATATSWYAIGIESDTMWFNSDNQYKWYVDAVQRMILDGSGNLTPSGKHYGNITSSGTGDSNAPFIFNADYSAWASHWAGTPGSNNGWGLFWAGNSGAQYGTNGTGGPGNIWSNSGNPNEAVFVGNGSTDWTLQLNAGNVWQKGTFYCAGDVYTSYSDKRLKDIIGPITNAVEKIKKIDTIYYTANELAKSLGVQEKGTQVGVTSQSVKEVLPEVVVQSPVNVDYDTVQYERLVPLLIAAIKEQQEQIEELKKKLGV